jgi:hypothetical protein
MDYFQAIGTKISGCRQPNGVIPLLMAIAFLLMILPPNAVGSETSGQITPFERLKLNMDTSTYSGQFAKYKMEMGGYLTAADESPGEGREEMLLPLEDTEVDQPVVSSYDLEKRKVQLETYYLRKSYKDGSSAYMAIPLTLRVDTGHNSEAFISSDFLTYQKPNFGINDITVGMKWQFIESNPSFAVIGTCEFPSGGAGLAAGGVQPSVILACDIKTKNKWEYTVNAGWVRNVDSKLEKGYDQIFYYGQAEYDINDKNSISVGFAGKSPDSYLNGTHLTYAVLGYEYRPRPGLSLNADISKGLSYKGEDWVFLFGIGQKL